MAAEDLSKLVTRKRYKLRARHSNKFLNIQGASHAKKAALIQWPDSNQLNEVFWFEDQGDGRCSIVACHSDRRLNASGNNRNPGEPIIQWSQVNFENVSPNEIFRLVSVDAHGFRIDCTHATGLCFNVSGSSQEDSAPIIQWPISGQTNEIFEVFEFPETLAPAADSKPLSFKKVENDQH